MLELMLCSLLTILPDYLFRRYVQGKRIGKEITLYSVWFELRWGITGCLILTVCLITIDLLQSPVHDQRHAVLQDRPDPFRDERARRGGVCRHRRRANRQRSPDLQAGQLEAGGRRGDRAAQDRGSRCRVGGGAAPTSRRPKARCRRPTALPADHGRTRRPSEELQRRNPGHRSVPRHRAAPGPRRRADWVRSLPRPPQNRRPKNGSRPAPGAKGQRRSRAGSRRKSIWTKTVDPRRRERASGAVRASGGRYRQSDHAPGRGADPRGRRPASPAGRLRTDRGADHESRE